MAARQISTDAQLQDSDNGHLPPCTPNDVLSFLIENNVTNWRVLGSQLGLHLSKLDEIERSHSIQEKMSRIIDAWFTMEPSWEKLQRALSAPSMGHNTAATKIACLRLRGSSSTCSADLRMQMSPSPLSGDITIPNVVNAVAVKFCGESIFDFGRSLGLLWEKLDQITKYPPFEHNQRIVEAWFADEPRPSWDEVRTALQKASHSTTNGSNFHPQPVASPSAVQSNTDKSVKRKTLHSEVNLDLDDEGTVSTLDPQLRFENLRVMICQELEGMQKDVTGNEFQFYVMTLLDDIKVHLTLKSEEVIHEVHQKADGETLAEDSQVENEVKDALAEDTQVENNIEDTLVEKQVEREVEQLEDLDESEDKIEPGCVPVHHWWKKNFRNIRLIWAARRGKTDSVQSLLKQGAQPNCNENDLFRWTPLMWASHNGHTDVVRVLLQQKDINPNIGAALGKWTPLILASRNGYHEIVDLLIKSGANVDTKNSFGWNALMWASHYRDYWGIKNSTDLKKKENLVKVAELLLENGADPNVEDKNGWTPVMQASQDGNDTFVKLLAEKGADLNHKDKKQRTFPLMIAVSKGHDHVVKELINGGTQLNLTNKKKQTALHIACYKKHEKIVEQIVESTRNTSVIDAQDELGLSPIMIGAKQKSIKIVELLRNAKANLNLQAEKYAKWTPLMFAVKSGNRQIVEMLLQSGVDVRLRDANGQSLIGIAKAFNGHMVQDLMDYYNDDVPSTSSRVTKPNTAGTEMEFKVVHEKQELENVHEPKDVDIAVDPTSATTDPVNKQAHKEPTVSTATQDAAITRETEQAVNRRKILVFLEQEVQADTHTIDSQHYNTYNKQYEQMYTNTIIAAAA